MYMMHLTYFKYTYIKDSYRYPLQICRFNSTYYTYMFDIIVCFVHHYDVCIDHQPFSAKCVYFYDVCIDH